MIQGGLAARKGDESNRHRPRYSTMVVTGRCYERIILVEVNLGVKSLTTPAISAKNAMNSNSIFSTNLNDIDLQIDYMDSPYQYFVYQPRARRTA